MTVASWRGVFLALLAETKGGSDDEIIAIIRRRFGSDPSAEIYEHSAQWREEDKQYGTLHTDGSVRHWSSGG
jgi:hypothetical protein